MDEWSCLTVPALWAASNAESSTSPRAQEATFHSPCKCYEIITWNTTAQCAMLLAWYTQHSVYISDYSCTGHPTLLLFNETLKANIRSTYSSTHFFFSLHQRTTPSLRKWRQCDKRSPSKNVDVSFTCLCRAGILPCFSYSHPLPSAIPLGRLKKPTQRCCAPTLWGSINKFRGKIQ